MAEKDVVDTFGPVEFFAEMVSEFGPKRTTELAGWCVMIGAIIKDGDGVIEVRDRLMKMGFKRSSVYRATADIKRFRHRLELKRGLTMSMADVLKEINVAGASHSRDFMIQ